MNKIYLDILGLIINLTHLNFFLKINIVMLCGLSIFVHHTDRVVQSELTAFLFFNNLEKLSH